MTSGRRSSPQPRNPAYTAEFIHALESPEFRSLARLIKQKCYLLLADPYGACKSERLKFDYAGKRSARVNKSVRLIYTICEECRAVGDEERNALECCLAEDCDLSRVTFLTITRHYT